MTPFFKSFFCPIHPFCVQYLPFLPYLSLVEVEVESLPRFSVSCIVTLEEKGECLNFSKINFSFFNLEGSWNPFLIVITALYDRSSSFQKERYYVCASRDKKELPYFQYSFWIIHKRIMSWFKIMYHFRYQNRSQSNYELYYVLIVIQITSFFFSLFFLLLYYKCFHPNRKYVVTQQFEMTETGGDKSSCWISPTDYNFSVFLQKNAHHEKSPYCLKKRLKNWKKKLEVRIWLVFVSLSFRAFQKHLKPLFLMSFYCALFSHRWPPSL